MIIRATTTHDLRAVLSVERAAFGRNDEAELVKALLRDPSAAPVLSLLALVDHEPLGHILFTGARLNPAGDLKTAAILAPLAVVPGAQRRGIGGRLIEAGFERLGQAGVALVFVLGYPEYYRRHGFEPAGRRGFAAPYPIPEKDADAWMVRVLRSDVIDCAGASVRCADTLNKPEYWRE